MLPLISKYVPGILHILLSSQIPYTVRVIIPKKEKWNFSSKPLAYGKF